MSFTKKPKTINPDEVDPSVYYYDEVYDDMKEDEKLDRSKEAKSEPDKPQGSKYIQGIKDSAELRKTEKELRKFKKYTQDREEAGEDEEVYVTSAYKKKLSEIKELEEEKKKQLQREGEKSMNFLHLHKKENDGPSGDLKTTDDLESKSDDLTKETKSDRPEVERSDHPKTEKRKQPKTYKEKKRYLREILAKRNVGRKFDDAVRRYKERKATRAR